MIEFLKDMYFNDDIKDFEGFKKYANQFNPTEEEAKLSYDFYIHKLWRSASEYFEKAMKRDCKLLGIR